MSESENQSDRASFYIIGLASFVPGLGFWLMGRKNQAYAIAGVVIGLMFVSAVAPWRSVRGLVFPLAYILWLGQIAWAVRIAKHGGGGIPQKKVRLAVKSAGPRNRSVQGKEIEASYLAAEIAKTQIVASERLRLSLIGKVNAALEAGISEDSVWYCVALTQINLLLIELDALMKPVSTRRISLRDVLVKRYQEGHQGAELVFFITNQGSLDLFISQQYRVQTRSMLAALR